MRGFPWIAALGEEVVYEADLPACCARTARVVDDSFECPGCGAMWRKPLPVEPEHDAFMQGDDEQRGAA
ncbi:MAG: hypothetical protein AVDCRST_MAG22-3070 [uncultured Rubrobacteraceae bacterium]|uniref:Uncharacterized protein n=1 Tax=uncultured Rubrobacteraceae bacterium TaxID=349277 RepID=A0A6J4Q4S7_9ACTN|nr:MAG: hypothetical protein AVDCRST_MAG22-3070 [uncultured Rubrobacteraceae bacterium]